MVKNVPKNKNIFHEVLCTSSDIIRVYNISDFLRQPVKKSFLLAGECRMVKDGENVLAGEHQFNLLLS